MKSKLLLKIFATTSCILVVLLFYQSIQFEKSKSREVRTQLSSFSSMMNELAVFIEEDLADKIVASASIIKESGAIGYVEENTREKIMLFLDTLSKEKETDKSRASAYARKCSLVAIKQIKGEAYQLEDYSNNADTNTTVEMTNNDIKHSFSKAREYSPNLRFLCFLSGKTVISGRANAYYLTNINNYSLYEFAYIENGKKHGARIDSIGNISENDTVCFDKAFISDNFDATYLLKDQNSLFLLCKDKQNNYIMGFDISNGKITHFKRLN